MSLKVIDGGKKAKIAGATIGETVLVHLTSNKVEMIVLSEITKIGIEGFEVNLKNRPLTFYPYNNILKIKKFSEIEG